MKTWLSKPVVYRTTLVLYVLCLVALFGAYVGVALWDVNHSVYVQGPKQLVRGEPTAMRAMIMNAQNGRLLRRAKHVTLGLIRANDKPKEGIYPRLTDEYELTSGRLKALHQSSAPLHFHYTTNAPAGKYTLVLRAKFIGEDEIFEAKTAIEVVEPTKTVKNWLEANSRRSEHEREPLKHGASDQKGPIRISVIPNKPELIRGLTSPVFLLTQDAQTGQPRPCTLTWTEQAGLLERPLPKQVQTNSVGLVKLNVTPMLSQRWKLQAKCNEVAEPSEATIYLETIATQLALTLNEPVISAGSKINGYVTSLHQSGWVHADLYMQDHWRHTGAFGLGPNKSGLQLNSQTDTKTIKTTTLARVQTFLDIYMQERVWDMRYLVVQPDQVDLDKAIAFVLKILKQHDHSTLQSYWNSDAFNDPDPRVKRRLLQAMLFALPRHFERPNILLNSLSGDQAKLEAKKAAIRQDLIIVIAIAMAVGIFALLGVVIQASRKYAERQRMINDLVLDLDVEDEQEEQDIAQRQRNQTRLIVFQAIVIVGTIVIFAAMMIVVLRHL